MLRETMAVVGGEEITVLESVPSLAAVDESDAEVRDSESPE